MSDDRTVEGRPGSGLPGQGGKRQPASSLFLSLPPLLPKRLVEWGKNGKESKETRRDRKRERNGK